MLFVTTDEGSLGVSQITSKIIVLLTLSLSLVFISFSKHYELV